MQTVGGEVAEAAAIVAAARRNQARGREERARRKDVAPRGRLVAVRLEVTASVNALQAAALHVAQDLRPQLYSFADRDCVGMRRGFRGLMLVAVFIALLVSYPHEVLMTMAYTYFASGFVGELIAQLTGKKPDPADVETDRLDEDAG